jgi:hypothetical protein
MRRRNTNFSLFSCHNFQRGGTLLLFFGIFSKNVSGKNLTMTKKREKYYEKKGTGSDDVPKSTKRLKVTNNEEPITTTQYPSQGDSSVRKDTGDYRKEQQVMSLVDTQKSEKSLVLSKKSNSIDSSKTSSNVEDGKPLNYFISFL